MKTSHSISRRRFLTTTTAVTTGSLIGLPLIGAPMVSGSRVRKAEIRIIGGTPQLFINNKPHNPLLCFMGPHRRVSEKDPGVAISAKDWATKNAAALQAITMAANNGIHIHSFSVWMPWEEENSDYSDAENVVEEILKLDPEGIFILRISMNPPFWWREKHPDELAMWDTGSGLTTRIEEKSEAIAETGVSVGSELWRKDGERFLGRFIAHMEGKVGDRIAGYHLIGLSYEWFYVDGRGKRMSCCEPAFLGAWQRWLRAKYKTPEALQVAWGSNSADFENIVLPTYEERLNSSIGFFRDTARERKVIDLHEYQNVAVVEAIERFSRVVKANSNNKLVAIFYGYLFELSSIPPGVQQSGHVAMGRLLKCPDVDIVCGPMSYMDRLPGGIGGFMPSVDSVALHGKLWYNEDDTRTHLAPNTVSWDPSVTKQEETRNVFKRQFSQMFPRRTSCWYMDLFSAGTLADKGIWQDIGKLKVIYDSVLGTPAGYTPEIAIICDEKSTFYLNQKPPSIMQSLLSQMRKSLYRIGTSCGYYLLEDLASGTVPSAKMYVFLNCFHLTGSEREAITKQCTGKTAVFFYGNGLIDQNVSVANMESLLGVPMSISTESVPGKVSIEKHDLTEGVPDFGLENPLSPVFYLDKDRGKETPPMVLARYTTNGEPAVWATNGSMKTVYIGAVTAPASLLRNIAKWAGAHLYCETDDVVSAGQDFMGIHASLSGTKKLSIPLSATVRDALTGEQIAMDGKSWSVEMIKGETKLYRWKKS